ncbi:GNAT family N-acetyltransferase [Trueperella sp.]|uniref:GNAT family N-acetyltransferase n=1 Tax=Trueperella sp. TaxID=2699835 RepID=UPI0022EB0CF6|nr:GNAT family N-acetyltransferase [Trueperella sp.]
MDTPAGLRLVRPSASWWPKASAFDVENFGPDAWPASVWEGELAAPGRTYLALVTDVLGAGTLVGLGGISHGPDAEVLTMAVASHMRGRGLGAFLLDRLLEVPRAHGADAVFLEVRAHDAVARRLYERAGFYCVGLRKRYYSDDDALIMRRDEAGGDEGEGVAPQGKMDID